MHGLGRMLIEDGEMHAFDCSFARFCIHVFEERKVFRTSCHVDNRSETIKDPADHVVCVVLLVVVVVVILSLGLWNLSFQMSYAWIRLSSSRATRSDPRIERRADDEEDLYFKTCRK